MLNEVRHGKVSQQSMQLLTLLERPLAVVKDGVGATQLYDIPMCPLPSPLTYSFCLRASAATANNKALSRLKSPTVHYAALDKKSVHYDNQADLSAFLDKEVQPEKTLSLKVGATVMMVRNLTPTLVNGTPGVVLGFVDQDHPRATDPTSTAPLPEPSVRSIDFSLQSDPNEWVYPIIKFKTSQGYEEVCVTEENFHVENAFGQATATRRQLPLLLAWAMTVHKSQGQSEDFEGDIVDH